jgi:hypothetical protein
LNEQLVLCALRLWRIDEGDSYAVRAKLVEQQHLIGVLAREPIGAVDVDSLDRTFGNAVS